jgi:hypothetical protein
MEQQQLSQSARKALKAVTTLPEQEQTIVVSLASADLAAKIAAKVSTATLEQRAVASSTITKQVNAALTQRLESTDGKPRSEVDITRASGKYYPELETYGKDTLEKATLLSHADYRTIVDGRIVTIRGLKVGNGERKTDDKALQVAYQIVAEGVRRDRGFSWAAPILDEGDAVAGSPVRAPVHYWIDVGIPFTCASFTASPGKSK